MSEYIEKWNEIYRLANITRYDSKVYKIDSG